MKESKATQLLNQLETNNTLEAIALKSLLTEVVTNENQLETDRQILSKERTDFELLKQDSGNIGDCLYNLIELLAKIDLKYVPFSNDSFSIDSRYNGLTDRIEYHIKLL